MCDSRLSLVSSWSIQDRRESMPQKQTVLHGLWDVGTPPQADKEEADFRAIKGLSVTEAQQARRPWDRTTVWSVCRPHRPGMGGNLQIKSVLGLLLPG